jgi:energy-coupling factor transporter ATP-binding protein EcfA2
MNRVVIVGTTGSGKTTLGRALAAALAVPRAEQDAFYHEAHWQPAAPEHFLARADAFTAQPAWVIDGNYALTRDLLWRRADTLVWLDYPAPLVFRRLLVRTVRRSFTREELWNGNRDRLLPNLFTADGLIPWFFRTHWRRRRETPPLIAAHPHLRVFHLRHPREADALVTAAVTPP